MIDFQKDHFQLFGLPQRFRVDRALKEQAYRDIQSQVHPDRVPDARNDPAGRFLPASGLDRACP